MYRLKLGDILRERGMTQTELAEQAGIRPATISMWARGVVDSVSLELVTKICDTLEIRIEDLIVRDEEPGQSALVA